MQGGCSTGTGKGKPQNPSNVRARVVARAVERANERLQEAGEAPLPRLTPHGLRRSFASLLYGIGEPPPVVMAEMGHTDPAMALSICAHAMRRGDGENERGSTGCVPLLERVCGVRARQDSNLRLLPPEDAKRTVGVRGNMAL